MNVTSKRLLDLVEFIIEMEPVIGASNTHFISLTKLRYSLKLRTVMYFIEFH